jgi:hypothetical protein
MDFILIQFANSMAHHFQMEAMGPDIGSTPFPGQFPLLQRECSPPANEAIH